MNRREFLSSSMVTLLLVPIGARLAGCGTDAGPSCDGVSTTSSVTNNHTHTLCVPLADLQHPPPNEQTYTTSTNAGHAHTVTLTSAQLQMIETGAQVQVTSSSPYPHDFLIRKL
jgi:hypothetical protein